MRSLAAALSLALALFAPVGNAAAAGEATTLNVYDYTRVGTVWTPLIIATVAEFNAVGPQGAPELTQVTALGDADCLDLADEVQELSGILVCDTSRPEAYPEDPKVPAEQGAITRERDDDTTVIVLNSVVPDGFYLPAEAADNTVCHEMMHAYTDVGDAYGTDPLGSCLWGDLLSPGPTDVRLMREHHPETVTDLLLPNEEPRL